MKNRCCLKCGDKHHLSIHHVIPRVFKKHDNNETVCLCISCHKKLESYLLACESMIGNVQFGVRYKLRDDDYRHAIRLFCHL